MKFVDLEKIWEKYPNKYLALVVAAKEVRKINEERKPPPLSRETEVQATAASSIPENAPIEPSAPKKRGRKPKRLTAESIETGKSVPKIKTPEDLFPVEVRSIAKGRGVVAEKSEENPYIAALNKTLK